MTDDEIIDLYLARKEQAIAETSGKYGARLKQLSRNIVSDEGTAEECVNDTYLHAWNSMPTHRPTMLAPYLAKLTRWLSLTRLRSGSALKRGGGELAAALDELAGTLDSGADTEKQLELRELNRAVRRLLDGLDKTERDVFLARYWYLAPLAEIAEKSGFTESKIKSMLHRTRKKLLRQLKEEGLC